MPRCFHHAIPFDPYHRVVFFVLLSVLIRFFGDIFVINMRSPLILDKGTKEAF